MSIPNDPLNRAWYEGNNTHLVDGLRSSLVGYLAFDHNHVPSLSGTGFIVAGANALSLAITAKHVLTPGVVNIQRPVPIHTPIFVPASSTRPSIHPTKLRAAWMGPESADLLLTKHVSYNDVLDIACSIFSPQEEFSSVFKPTAIPMDTTIPPIGDVVHMVSLTQKQISDYTPATNGDGSGASFSIQRRVCIRVGFVTNVFPNGFRQYRWPCFTTSIPTDPGMSGGFVYLPRDGQTVSACGIVSADNSEREAHTNNHVCGESVIASTWPALCLNVPMYEADGSPMRTLYEMMRAGDMPVAVGGIDHIQVIDLGNGEYRMINRHLETDQPA